MLDSLPIDDVVPGIAAAVREHGAVVVHAPPGAGKTTRVPPALLDVVDGRILVLEPRRVAARAAARRIAAERGWTLGREVGYEVRLERVHGPGTRIVVLTEGILARMIASDPLLPGVGAVVLDEFHERSIHADLALAMAWKVRGLLRPDLEIAVMSATFDPSAVASYLGGCPVVESEGRVHPVEIRHVPPEPGVPLERAVAEAVADSLGCTGGDVLVFLPGMREIREAAEALGRKAPARGVEVLPLHGDLPREAQDRALDAGGRRKVVLATNVAETSITIPGVTAVVDSGLARVLRFDEGSGLDRLEVERISLASADQRAGRAGRTGPGICTRLWAAAETGHMRPEIDPEIRRVDLAAPVLTLLAWGEDPHSFAWFDPPEPAAVDRAFGLLEMLGAIEGRLLSPRGRAMAGLPVHPRLGRMILEGHDRGCLPESCAIAARLSEGGRAGRGPRGRLARVASRSDVVDMLEAPGTDIVSREASRLEAAAARVPGGAAKRLDAARREEALLRCVLAAWPDRVARRRSPKSDRGIMTGGIGVRLAPTSAVVDADLFACADVEAGRRGARSEALVRMASEVDPSWLPGGRLAVSVDTDLEGGRVRAIEHTRYLDLVVSERQATPDPERAAAILAEAVSRDPAGALGLDEEPLRTFLARVRFLADRMPPLGLPRMDRQSLIPLLPSLCLGCGSLHEVRNGAGRTIRGLLTRRQIAALDMEAPERIQVPSAARIALDWGDGSGPPVLAVRIQDVFGMRKGPRVAGGTVPVVLHLLAPNGRPQQVTSDLASFWRSGYPVVRKELRARYPRHAWPEDPLSAKPPGPGRRKR